MSSSLDLGSDKSDVPMKSSVKSPCSPNREIEKHPDLPEDWKPPSRFHVRLCFTALCYFSVGKPNLEELWQEVREEGWKKPNELFRCIVQGFLWMQGFALFYYFRFMLQPPRIKIAENACTVHFNTLFFLSFVCSLLGLFCHVLFWRSDTAIKLHETINQRMQKPFYLSRRKVLTHVALVRMTDLAAVCSMGCLAGGFIPIIFGGTLFTSLAAAGVVALLLHAMIMDGLLILLMLPFTYILYVGLAMRYASMQQW